MKSDFQKQVDQLLEELKQKENKILAARLARKVNAMRHVRGEPGRNLEN